MKRTSDEMPKQGQVVVVEAANSNYNGCAGYVSAYNGNNNPGRPYSVKFNDGETRNFRRGEVWLTK